MNAFKSEAYLSVVKPVSAIQTTDWISIKTNFNGMQIKFSLREIISRLNCMNLTWVISYRKVHKKQN